MQLLHRKELTSFIRIIFMGENVATLELEFYLKLFKRHTEELFLLINEKMS